MSKDIKGQQREKEREREPDLKWLPFDLIGRQEYFPQ